MASKSQSEEADEGGLLGLGNRGQSNLVGLILGIVVAGIVAIGVGIPIINDVISSTNISGTTLLIVGFIPTMLALMIFVATASPIMSRT